MKTPNGKIARLPRNIRDELNQRLENGEPADTILPWLNSLPEVKAMLADWFADSPVNRQNLTNWRQGGYLYWLEGRQHHDLVRELVQDAKEFSALPGAPDMASQMSTVFLAELAVSARQAQTELTDPAERFERLRSLLHPVCQVRREDCQNERLALDRERQAPAGAGAFAGQAPGNGAGPSPTSPNAFEVGVGQLPPRPNPIKSSLIKVNQGESSPIKLEKINPNLAGAEEEGPTGPRRPLRPTLTRTVESRLIVLINPMPRSTTSEPSDARRPGECLLAANSCSFCEISVSSGQYFGFRLVGFRPSSVSICVHRWLKPFCQPPMNRPKSRLIGVNPVAGFATFGHGMCFSTRWGCIFLMVSLLGAGYRARQQNLWRKAGAQ